MRLSGDNPGCFGMALVMCGDKARLLSDMGSLHVCFDQCADSQCREGDGVGTIYIQPPFGAAHCRSRATY